MTIHPSQTGSENRIAIMWTVAVGQDAWVWGRMGPRGPSSSVGSLCVYSDLPLGLQTGNEQGKHKPFTKLFIRAGLLGYEIESHN